MTARVSRGILPGGNRLSQDAVAGAGDYLRSGAAEPGAADDQPKLRADIPDAGRAEVQGALQRVDEVTVTCKGFGSTIGWLGRTGSKRSPRCIRMLYAEGSSGG